jgi:hypothetical protein
MDDATKKGLKANERVVPESEVKQGAQQAEQVQRAS